MEAILRSVNGMSVVELSLWVVIVLAAVVFLAVVLVCCELRYRQWFKCIHCNRWFNLLGCTRNHKPEGVAWESPGGMCRHCESTWSKRVRMNGRAEQGMLFPRYPEHPTDLSDVKKPGLLNHE